jgi:hypothetical protein
MSLGKQDVVPVDTHIHSIAVTYYGQNKKLQLNTKNYDDISSFFEQLWKPFAGWAQAVSSFLFYRLIICFSQAAFSNELRGSKVRIQSRQSKRSINNKECQKKKFLSIKEEIVEC